MNIFNRKLFFVVSAIFILILFIADQAIKRIFVFYLPDRQFFIFGQWLKLKMSLNHGIAFGLPFPQSVLIVITGLLIVVLLFFAYKSIVLSKAGLFFFTFLAAFGALSNFLDRILYNGVIDYLFLRYYSVFNLADIMIFIGLLGLAALLAKSKQADLR